MAQNGISTETVYMGCGAIDPIATKIQRRTDKLALAQCTRGYTIYGYRPLNQILGTHQSYVNGACGPSLQTLSGTNSPAVGHPWTRLPPIDIIIARPAEVGIPQQIAGSTYLPSATTFITNGFVTQLGHGNVGFNMLAFSTATSQLLTTVLGSVATAPTPPGYRAGFFHAQWSAGSSQPTSFAYVTHYQGGTTGNPDGTGVFFNVVDGALNDIAGTWIFPVSLTLVQQLV